jgi:hypothetical protein
MVKKIIFAMICTLWLYAGVANAQSPAALANMEKLYSAEHLQEMQNQDPAKYHSMVWYMAHSFLVVDQGGARPATETEISAIQIKQYDHLRTADQRVTVEDKATGISLVLLGADECFEQLKSILPSDQWQHLHAQYLRNRALRNGAPLPKSTH